MTRKTPKLPITKPSANYDIGYGKPPTESRFRSGQSGNPRGRPKGSKNKRPALHEERLKGIILEEAYRDITVNDAGRNVTLPMAQAIVRSLAVNAAKGQSRAQRLFAELLASTESANKFQHDQWLETAIAYKVDWEKELRRREELGIADLPEPLPHPDHVVIDFEAGTATIVGPMTKDEKEFYDLLLERRSDYQEELEYLLGEREATDDPELLQDVDDDIKRVRRILDIIEIKIGA